MLNFLLRLDFPNLIFEQSHNAVFKIPYYLKYSRKVSDLVIKRLLGCQGHNQDR